MAQYRMRGLLLLLFTCSVLSAAEPDAVIHVHADRKVARVSPYTTGACIEDVNHEIYGGLYSQMVFGESFQEPPIVPGPLGFSAYGGTWRVQNGELYAIAGQGYKLIHDGTQLKNGEVSVELQFADRTSGNGGLILRVDRPGLGADHFTGYEVALHPDTGTLLLGRHRQNWEPIRTIPCPVPLNEWIKLSVRLEDRNLQISVNGKEILTYEDNEHPLLEGKIGLRTWQRDAKFRNLVVVAGDQNQQIPIQETERQVDAVSGMWRAVRRGDCQGSLSVDSSAFIGEQSQRMTFDAGSGEIGVENRGLNRWGMNWVAERPYNGFVWVKAEQPSNLHVSLEDRTGAVALATKSLPIKRGDWQKIDFTLTPARTDTRGRLTLALRDKGSIVLGHVAIHPGEWGQFKGLPVRRDVSEKLVNQGLTVLRYGGSMVNCAEYRWKKMIGPRDRRPPYRGTWYPYSTNGWGIIDFISFCEAAGFLCIPDLNMDETPQDMADFVEYINGPVDSPWGKRRAEDGHPQPYRLKYIQLGNEEAVNDVYWQKFKPLVEAIWSRDPDIIPVVGDFAYGQHITDPYKFTGAPSITSLAAHKKILDFAKENGKPVWFDIHIWNDGPRDADLQIEVLSEFIDWLGKLSPGADYRVCVFEENSNNHLWRRGLSHARTVNKLQRFGEKVPIVCAANCLQPDHQNDNGWDQGLVFLSPSNVWTQSPASVTRMMASNNLPHCVATECHGPNEILDVTARLSEDGQVLGVQIVNIENRPLTARLKLSGKDVRGRVVKISQISGHLDERNTEEDPERIVPHDREWRPDVSDDGMIYVIPAQSFSILRFE